MELAVCTYVLRPVIFEDFVNPMYEMRWPSISSEGSQSKDRVGLVKNRLK
jgi:hypothetical protein